jgi:site-specific DNA-methyltransferase (adenine-specific)
MDIRGENYFVMAGSCLDRLTELADESVDAVVTDPPYELGFMGKSWDNSGIAYNVEVWRECLRVLKPGGHLLAFGGSRTWHRLAVAIEDAGFEVRDSIAWLYGSGFPKSHNLKDEWQGWGTALKPAFEPIIMGRKPLAEKTVAANVLKYGTGAMNIDGTRIAGKWTTWQAQSGKSMPANTGGKVAYSPSGYVSEQHPQGRWPANVMLDEYTAELVDEQSGFSKGVVGQKKNPSRSQALTQERSDASAGMFAGRDGGSVVNSGTADSGGASRFFYVSKANKRDRNEGDANNTHPTVKPTDLMRELIKLVTPKGGTVLDPFTGSGSTGKAALLEGNQFIGVELTEEYLPIIEARLNHANKTKPQTTNEGLF